MRSFPFGVFLFFILCVCVEKGRLINQTRRKKKKDENHENKSTKKVMGKLEYLRALRAPQTAAHPPDLPERFSNPPLNNNNNDNKNALFTFLLSLQPQTSLKVEELHI